MTTLANPDPLVLYGQTFHSRLLLGTARYPSPDVLEAAVKHAKPAMLTASLRRQTAAPGVAAGDNGFWELLRRLAVPVLPNTAGCHGVKEVIATAQMAREVFDTPWIKLELIGDDYTLQPDTLNLVDAASQLIRDGFQVLPYCTDDLVLCQRLVDVGCQAVMPWAAPIGTGKGPINPYALQLLRERLDVPLLVDAGLGLPSHACQVMEWGYDGVLLNTAVALAQDPVAMAGAFADAVQAGRTAHRAGAMAAQESAQASTPVLGTPFWHHAMNMTDIPTMAAAIVEAHGARFGTVSATTKDFSQDDPVYRAAKTACTTLGFIERDAECLALAWLAQTQRTGRFDAQAWPETPADFGMRSFPPAVRDDAFAPCPERLGLYAVLPDAAWVGRMARAGVPTVQLRFKSDDDAAITREVQAAVEAVRATNALLFINDHWQAAIAAGAYGVHLGQEDLDALGPVQHRLIRDAGVRLGVSTHGYAEMVRADAVSPSYIAMGAVFPTTLKQMATAPQGVARLGAYARLLRGYPQVAIGGIDAARLPEVLATGVGSVGVVRALIAADDPEAQAASLIAALKSGTLESAP